MDSVKAYFAGAQSKLGGGVPLPRTSGEVMSLLSPITLFLFSFLLLMIYIRTRPVQLPTLPPPPKPVVFRTFTPPTLLPYNGSDGKPVYLAVRGRIYDVTPGKKFYGPGGPYENFAGRDATRGLACTRFDDEMITKDLEGPLDDLKDLGADEMESLSGWEETFQKYLIVGRLVPVGSPEAKEAEKS